MAPSRMVVLIVEDEPLLRMHTASIIDDAGFESFAVGDADSAIEILESDTHIDFVFTDIDLPASMDGIRLSAVIANRWPPVRLILTSGKYHPGATALPEGLPFLSKPYAPHRLVALLRG